MFGLEVQRLLELGPQRDFDGKHLLLLEPFIELQPDAWKQRLRMQHIIQTAHPVGEIQVRFDRLGADIRRTINFVRHRLAEQSQPMLPRIELRFEIWPQLKSQRFDLLPRRIRLLILLGQPVAMYAVTPGTTVTSLN